jgi:MFS family permease
MNAESGSGIGSTTRRQFSLDALNFLLADVRGALGPYLNVFLVTQQGWSQSSVGVMTTIGGLIGLAAQTPAGAAIDATPAKRGVIVIALVGLAFGAVAIFAVPTFWPVLARFSHGTEGHRALESGKLVLRSTSYADSRGLPDADRV